MGLGLKYVAMECAARSASNQQAILMRALKPNSVSISQILKNEKLIQWDDMLVLSVTKKLFNNQINYYTSRHKRDKARALTKVKNSVLEYLIEDLLLVSAPCMCAVMSSFWTQDPTGLAIKDSYSEQRSEFTSDPINRVRHIAGLCGICIAFNFKKEGCNNNNCPYKHICVYNQTQEIQHPTMECASNPCKWKNKQSNNFNNNNRYNNRRGRGRGVAIIIDDIIIIIINIILNGVIHPEDINIHHINFNNILQIKDPLVIQDRILGQKIIMIDI